MYGSADIQTHVRHVVPSASTKEKKICPPSTNTNPSPIPPERSSTNLKNWPKTNLQSQYFYLGSIDLNRSVESNYFISTTRSISIVERKKENKDENNKDDAENENNILD